MICRIGRWLTDSVIKNYLVVLPPGVTLPAAGFPPSPEAYSNQYYHPRFDLVTGLGSAERLKLQLIVYPFLADLVEAAKQNVSAESKPQLGGT